MLEAKEPPRAVHHLIVAARYPYLACEMDDPLLDQVAARLASVNRVSWAVLAIAFTPNSGRIAARQRTDAPGHEETCHEFRLRTLENLRRN